MNTAKASPFGWDLFVGPTPTGIDVTPEARGCGDVELVANKILYRSLAGTLPVAGAPGGAVDFGENVRLWVGSANTDATASSRAQRLAIVYGRIRALDPGTIRVQVTTQAPPGAAAQHDFYITVTAMTTTARPVQLVMGVSSVTVDILSQGT
jgi:hypothetical protein